MSNSEYTLEDKVDTLHRLRLNNGNVSQTARETNVNRNTIAAWRDKKDQIIEKYHEIKDTELTEDDKQDLPANPSDQQVMQKKEEKWEIKQFGDTYTERKDSMSNRFESLAFDFLEIAKENKEDISAKDAVWAAGTAIENLRKLNGEPSTIIRYVDSAKELFVKELFAMASEGKIEFKSENAKQELADRLDNIQEAEYEEVKEELGGG